MSVTKGASKVVKIPIENVSKHDLFLSGRTILGTLEEVAEVKSVDCPRQNDVPVNQSMKA